MPVGQNVAIIQIIPWAIVKVKPGARYCTHQFMIKIFGDHKFRWTEVLPSDQRLELPGEGSLFKSNSNKCRGCKMQPQFKLSPESFLKSGLGRLARYGTHEKRGLNRSIFHLTQDWNGLRMGHYSSLKAFISFNLPILTDKSLNITLLPRKFEKRSER